MSQLRAEVRKPESGGAGAKKNSRQNQGNDHKSQPFVRSFAGDQRRFLAGRLRGHSLVFRRKWGIRKLRRPDKTVASARNRFDKSWFFRGLAERLAKLIDGCVDVGVVVYVCVGRPEGLLELLARDYFPLFVNQDQQHLVDLALQTK